MRPFLRIRYIFYNSKENNFIFYQKSILNHTIYK